MKYLAKIVRESFNDRRIWALSFIAFTAIAVSVPHQTFAVSTSYEQGILAEVDGKTGERIGICQSETVSGTPVVCATGVIPALLSKIDSIIGISYEDTQETYAQLNKDPYNAENWARLERLSDRGNSSLLGIANSASQALVDQRPASGVIYTNEVFAKVFSPDKAYAAAGADIDPYFPGTGFELLTPIRTIWSYLVGLSYSFMIILVVIVALALMFRAKLSGDQAVQLQTAIPGIVMAMILIPLSYPISGLFIDGITLGANAVHGFFFGPAGVFRDTYTGEGASSEQVGLRDANPQAGDLSTNRGLYIDDPRLNIFGFQQLINPRNVKDDISNGACGIVNQNRAGVDIGNISCKDLINNAGAYNLIQVVIGGLSRLLWEALAFFLNLLFNWFSLFVAFRIGWRLFKQFLTMMILPTISSLVFASLAIPGRGNALVMWYLKRMGNVTANFVAAYALLLLSAVFSAPSFINLIPDNAIGTLSRYQPPLISGFGFGNATSFIGASADAADQSQGTIAVLFFLIGFGIYVMTPGILQKITEALAPKEENPFTKLFMEEAAAAGTMAFRQAPAVGRDLGGRFVDKSLGAATRWYGGNKANRFEKSRGEKYVEKKRDEISKAYQDAYAATGRERAWLMGRAKMLEAQAELGARARGQTNAFTPKAGEKPPSISLTIEGMKRFSPSAGGNRTQFNIAASDITSPTIEAALVISAPDDATPPKGLISYAQVSGPALALIGSGGSVTINGTAGAKLSAVSGVVIITGPGKLTFTGGKKVTLPIIITLPSIAPGAYSTNDPIEIAVGEGNQSPSASIAFDINILNR